MTRTDEIIKKQKALNDMVEKINGNGLIRDQHQLTNISLATIGEQLSDISTSLAMLVDSLRREKGE